MTDLNTPIDKITDPRQRSHAIMFRLAIALGREPVGNDIEGWVLEFNPEALLTEAEVAIIAAHRLPASAAVVWAEAIETARTTILRRKGTYEADIDLLALENPYSAPASDLVHGHRQDETCGECLT